MKKIFAILFAVVLAVALALPVAAEPEGPFRQPEQEVKLERLLTYDELVKALNQIEQSSQGTVTLEWYGPTVQGRDLPLAIIGTGPTPILIIAQQHGNEPMTCQAAVGAIKYLGSAGNSEVEQILEKFTVLIMPRVNPDGAEMQQRRNADGYDINRDHNPANYPDDFNTFEAATVRDIWEEYKPMIFLDLHHMGTRLPVTVNVHRPVNEDSHRPLVTPDDYPGWPGYEGREVQSLSKQIGAQMYETLEKMGIGEVELYSRGHASSNPDISRNAYGMLGSATQLVEIRGQMRSLGQKSSGYLIQLPYRSIMTVLVSAADGSLFEVDPADYEVIPPGDTAWPPEEYESH